MAATFAQAKGAQGSGGATSMAVSLTGVGAGNHLSTFVWSWTAVTAATTSTPTATWQNAIADWVPTGSTITQRSRVDYTENTASGSWTISGNASASSWITTTVSESAGVATSSSLGVTATSSTASLASAVTPTVGSILISDMTDSGSATGTGTVSSTGNTPFTVDEPAGTVWNSPPIANGTAHFANAAATATNVTWSTSATAHATQFVEFLASAARTPYQPWYQRAPVLAQ